MRMKVDVVSTGTTTRVVIGDVQKERLGWERQIPVAFELDGQRFRATVVYMHGEWCFIVTPKMRERGLTPGRRHTIDLARDQEPEPFD
ncbi:MAG TPA: hypothetical protein VJ745_06650 [Gaiellaceae bacterium]|nr:hypothetical protein [Gaiellaceae bacterium]